MKTNVNAQRGNVATDPTLKNAGGTEIAEFTVAVDVFERTEQGGWNKTGTEFVKVEWWGGGAANVVASLSKGDPILLTGTSSATAYINRRGEAVVDTLVRATQISPDFTRATASISRVRRSDGVQPEQAQQQTPPQPPAPEVEQDAFAPFGDEKWAQEARQWNTASAHMAR